MRSFLARPFLLLTALLGSVVHAEKLLKSTSLNTCQKNSDFTASHFNVVFTPGNHTAHFEIESISSIEGYVVFDLLVSAYGYPIIERTLDPCELNFKGLCPMNAGKIPNEFNVDVGEDAVKNIPTIAYTMPDIDAKVRVMVNLTSGDRAGESVACVEADISNGKTVNLLGVKWATAVIAGLALAASAVISGLGHTNAASHVATNALSLFGYFQAQAMIGLTGVPLPPVVQAWTQDFQWTMGIIQVDFMQDIFTWYQRSTGGTPSTLFHSLGDISVQVEKRALLRRGLEYTQDAALDVMKRSVAMMPKSVAHAARSIARRGNIMNDSGSYVVYGIQRVAFRAHIESTNLFLTGLVFFCIFVVLTILGVALFKALCELAVKQKWMSHDKFLDFRNGWQTVLKGILFRLTIIGYPQMVILCLWEFTQRDSAAEVVLAVFFVVGMTATLGWAAFKVIRIARRSVVMHHNPAYILFSDPHALNKWGFLYVQFRASAYYFIVPVLGYLLVKGMFIALAQSSGTVQAVAFIIIEVAALIAASVLRPWMDKSTNSFNIAICVINFLNSIFLLIFTDVFNQPPLVTGVVGVVLWIANAVFALVLLLMLIISTTLVFIRKNPDNRYQAMADDRTSFMKSQTQLTTTTELDALAATARGDKAGYKAGLDLDDDAESISSDSLRREADSKLPMTSAHSASSTSNVPPRSPVSPSMPLFPAESQRGSPAPQVPGAPYLRAQPSAQSVNRSPSPFGGSQPGSTHGSHPSPAGGYPGQPGPNPAAYRSQQNSSPAGARSQNNASPWQRGAGYEH